MKKAISLLLLLTFSAIGFSYFYGNQLFTTKSEEKIIHNSDKSEITEEYEDWAVEILQRMTLEEKIAQITMLRIHSNFDATYEQQMIEEIEKYQPGGVCFFQGGPIREINLTNKIQSVSKIPLLVSMDAEWGIAMRLDSVQPFPRQMGLGALSEKENHLIYEMGYEIGRQCVEMGIHINFAPVIDINNNAANPVINSRSFGEERESVTEKGKQYMLGMQDAGIITCLKHFPGHGDTETDSHKDLPVITKSFNELDSLELYPFRQLINAGADMVMIAHLNVPALDDEPNSISSLSYNIITDLLKKEYGFDGIVITDALDMNGLRKSYPKGGEAEIKALLSGVDILLLPNKLSVIIPAIKEAVLTGIIPEELIDEKCLKVLRLKDQLNLHYYKPLDTVNIYQRLNTPQTEKLIQTIEEKAITLLKNKNFVLPLEKNDSTEAAVLIIGGLTDSAELKKICREKSIPCLQVDKEIAQGDFQKILTQLQPYKKVIACILGTNQTPKYNYGITTSTVNLLKEICKKQQTILSIFGNAYALDQFGSTDAFESIIIGYQPYPTLVEKALAAINGETDFYGHLPVSTKEYKAGTGIAAQPIVTIEKSGYSILDTKYNRRIDSLIEMGIDNKIFPGCQILAIQNGQTVYHKNFGKLTYDKNGIAVRDATLYDIASMTKSAATTLAVMKLFDEKKFKLTDSIGRYLKYLQNTDKQNIRIEELLTHTSGLPAFIPFYLEMTRTEENRQKYFREKQDEQFSIEVAEGMYLDKTIPDQLRKKIADCKLSEKKYVYSDLSFVLLKDLVETLTNKTLERYLRENFYAPLELKHTSFHPLKRFDKSKIAPTENDQKFRRQIVQGYVHDQTSALFGGTAGNAGLFSNVSDLSVIFQLLMNGGIYNGKRYLSSETVNQFISTHCINGCERRGLGFDTPSFAQPSSIIPSESSRYTFGHQGFTGTVFWCDPNTKLIYIFLSNRVYPDTEPNKLSKSGIRLHVHKVICEGLKN